MRQISSAHRTAELGPANTLNVPSPTTLTRFPPAVSTASDCLNCSTFFRRLLIDAGEDPASLALDDFDELIVDFGRRLGTDPHSVDDALRARLAERLDTKQIVTLTAFGAIMVATNVFNDALGVELDGYLHQYAA